MGRKPTSFLAARLIAVGIGAAVLATASLTVKQRGAGPLELPDEALRRGPDSYFHHIYDPGGLLGPLGQVDLDLDNFQRATGTAILFAAFESSPGGDPGITMRLAQLWAPGTGKLDRGLVVFVFFGERRVRAETGYGLEDLLPDAAMRRLLEETMGPPLAGGRPAEAVEAVSRALQERLGHLKPEGATGGSSLLETIRDNLPEFRLKARLAGRIWLAAGTRIRLFLSGILLAFWAALVWFAADIGTALARLVRFAVNPPARREALQGVSVAADLALPLLRAVQVGFILFAMATGGSYFLPGTGGFGGGGAEIHF